MRFACSTITAGWIRTWLRDTLHPLRIAARFLQALAVLAVGLHAVLIVLVFLASLVLLKANPPFTALMVWRGATAHQAARPVRFVPLRQIPRAARSMVVRLEDYRFYSHHGVDLGALREAWAINAAMGRTAVGGSTIPMQLARNLFLTPRKTYFRKYLETVIALEMDAIIPKDRLLELYLNYIEWGRGIFGIGAASAYYYRTGVGGLGLDEMRRLATIITNPLRYDVYTFPRSAQMSQRYAYLVSRFPDPAAEPLPGPPPSALPQPQEQPLPLPPPQPAPPQFPAAVQPSASPPVMTP